MQRETARSFLSLCGKKGERGGVAQVPPVPPRHPDLRIHRQREKRERKGKTEREEREKTERTERERREEERETNRGLKLKLKLISERMLKATKQTEKIQNLARQRDRENGKRQRPRHCLSVSLSVSLCR